MVAEVLGRTDCHSLPSLAVLHAAHAQLSTRRAGLQAVYDDWDTQPVFHEPCMGGPQHRYHPSGLPAAHAAAYQGLDALLALPPFLLRGLQLNYMRTVHHCNWHEIHSEALRCGDDAYASILIDASQLGAGDYLRALPSCPATSINSTELRVRLLRQLRLPLRPRSGHGPYGDDLVNANGHSHRHTEVLNVAEQVASRAHGVASVYREPSDHEDVSPGYKPDLLVLGGAPGGGNELVDAKVGSTIVKDISKPRLRLAAQVAFAEIGPRFILKVKGLDQVGQPSEPAFNKFTGVGYRPAVSTCDYAGALDNGQTVTVLAHNTFGGLTPESARWWRRKCREVGNRISDTEAQLSPTAVSFRAYFMQRHSCSVTKAVSQQILRGLRADERGRSHTRRPHHARTTAAQCAPRAAAAATAPPAASPRFTTAAVAATIVASAAIGIAPYQFQQLPQTVRASHPAPHAPRHTLSSPLQGRSAADASTSDCSVPSLGRCAPEHSTPLRAQAQAPAHLMNDCTFNLGGSGDPVMVR